MVIAVGLYANLPGWVGLTVLFVMHPDDAIAVRLMAQRIGGTLVGIALAGVVVHFVHAPSLLAALAIVVAALLPKAMSANFFWLSSVVTVLVMVLLDLALLATGGDAPLLKWRLYDTLLGCLAVAIALSAIRLLRRWQTRIRPPAERAADADPPDAPAPPVDPGT